MSTIDPFGTRKRAGAPEAHGGGSRQETLRTWRQQQLAALEPRPQRRVDWPLVVGGGLRLPLSQAPLDTPDVFAVLRALDELGQYRDLNTLLRRAVELCRSEVGLERVAIFLHGESPELLTGTWGTGPNGETTDEREIAFVTGSAHREAVLRSNAGIGRWLVLDDAPLTAHLDKKTSVIGYGWNVLTPIRSARGVVGLLVNDGGLSGAAFDEPRQVRAAIFCALFGNLLDLVRTERQLSALLPNGGAARLSEPAGAQSDSASLATRVVALLQDDHTLSRSQLATRVGVSVSGLSRAFKSELGLSVAQYRNRLRLERFLVLVDSSGGNLLAAALDAGFGSYAQFHRVFRSAVGKGPKEYLAQRALVPSN